MNNLLMFFVFALVGFAGMYFIYKPQSDKYEQTLKFSYRMLPLPYIYAFYALGSITAYIFLDNSDFIESLTFIRMILPLILTPVIYASCVLFGRRAALVCTIVCVGITLLIQPLGDGNSYPQIPVWGLRLLVFIFASIYCIGGIINNFIPHTFLIPKIAVLVGLSMMAALGAAPAYIAMCAAVLGGALGGYLSINFYEVKIEIDNAAAIAISYMVCSLLLMNMGELSFPCCIILTSVFWAELIVAVWRRYFVVRAGGLYENTNYYLAAQKLSVRDLVLSILKVCGIIMFLAWFQMYAVNSYSLIIIALCLTLWLNSSIGLPNGGKRSLREINQDFIADLKQNIKETKEALSKRSKDKQ